MKQEYRFYGRASAELEKKLTEKDREILAKYISYCSTTAGPGKLKNYRMYMIQFRDVVEKPFDEVTKEDAIALWGLIHQAPHEANTSKRFMFTSTTRT